MAEPQVQLSERDRYVQQLEEKLKKAGKARRFLDSEDGGVITDYLTQRINAIVQQIGGTKYINDHEGYVFSTGKLAMARELLVMLNKEASTDTEGIKTKIQETKTDEAS